MSDPKIWIHYYITSSGKIRLPIQNRGPYYNSRKYGSPKVMDGQRAYRDRRRVISFLKYHHNGRIICDDNDYIIWKYETTHDYKGFYAIDKAKFSVFKRIPLEASTEILLNGRDDGEKD